MMAGEIGASVIVVKEVEIPLNVLDQASRRISHSDSATEVDSSTTEVEEETEEEASDLELDPLERTASDTIFSMDNEAEEHPPNYLAVPRSDMPVPIDLEIAVVYKPRPFRKRDSDDFVLARRDRRHGKGKGKGKGKKSQPPPSTEPSSAPSTSTIDQLSASLGKPHNRRLARDRRREDRRLALLSSNQAVDEPVDPANTEVVSRAVIDEVTHSLEGLHVPTSPVLPSPVSIDIIAAEDDEDEENVSSSPLVAPRVFDMAMKANDKPGVRLIVEALVVRKLSIEEGFLDFEGFQIS
ncbi:hypothetical protein ONZ45_g13836 [Pleurotus djamor]|nr:hypothetical protein ONZ45_g13836 [Pleurotus djamor]